MKNDSLKISLVALALLLTGCKEQDAYAMCYRDGYPSVKRIVDNGRVRYYCHRVVNATDEMKEVRP